ncbi:Hypothetical protein SMAX5B_021759 [Scophthalmus maximus]|uniref:ribonuclease H n=1 Tax=Scophthalmus maximus TaxID=52904 RepID=A0A2U9D132_SCOMX|nr:Hypothetical protein SMAX5B_021759 [Scophthalmus maximus]
MRVDPSDQYKLAFYMDGCSYHHESQIRAGAGIVWVNRSAEEPNNYWLGNKTSQYAEIAAVLIALQQATKLAKVQLVISSDSNYARMTVYWKKVKGHSQTSGPDKNGNDEADRLAKLGAEQGSSWEFRDEWLPVSKTCAVSAITRRQARKRREDPQNSAQTMHLGRKPDAANLVTMHEQDPAIQTMLQLVKKTPTQGTSQVPSPESSELHALHKEQPHLKLFGLCSQWPGTNSLGRPNRP